MDAKLEKVNIETKSWNAPEYHHIPRSIDWYWGLGIVALIGAVLAFWFSSVLFGIFILLSASVLIMLGVRKPKEITFEINSDGFKMEHKFFEWKEIKGFDIKESSHKPNPEGKVYARLLVLTNKNFLPLYTLPIPEDIVEEINISLKKVIQPLELSESQAIQFAEKIGL
jgi:hypothetical protein